MSWPASGIPKSWSFERSIVFRLLLRRTRRLVVGLWPARREELLAAHVEAALLRIVGTKGVLRPVTDEGVELFNDEAEATVSLHTPSSDHVQLEGTSDLFSASYTITALQLHIDGVKVLTAETAPVFVTSSFDVRWCVDLHASDFIDKLVLRELVHFNQHGGL